MKNTCILFPDYVIDALRNVYARFDMLDQARYGYTVEMINDFTAVQRAQVRDANIRHVSSIIDAMAINDELYCYDCGEFTPAPVCPICDTAENVGTWENDDGGERALRSGAHEHASYN